MNEAIAAYRSRVIEMLTILSSEEEQVSYQKNVPYINVPDELLCQWFDGLDMPKGLIDAREVFSIDEINLLQIFCEHFNRVGALIRRPNEISLDNLLEEQDWRSLMQEASALLVTLKRVQK